MESFARFINLLPENSAGVVVTVLNTGGSTPRKAGARMHVSSEGKSTGTIGGGWIEHKAVSIALEMIEDNTSCLEKTFKLGGPATNTPMLCGGKVDLFFQKL